MNRENIKKVRDVIAALPAKRFDMSSWQDRATLRHDCNTAACIGGWTEATIPRKDAWRALGLSQEEALPLFFPSGYESPGAYTAAHAVRVLDHLLETGEVDWKSTRRAKKPAEGQ